MNTAAVDKVRRPWWLYINLLGLDAPAIAVVWLFLFAKTWRVDYHPWEAYAGLGLFVWAVRMALKLLAESMGGDEDFYKKHRTLLRKSAMGVGAAAGLVTVLSFPLSGYSYFLIGGVLMVAYCAILLFSAPSGVEPTYAKHLVAGCSFAYGVAVMAHAYLPGLGVQEMVFSQEFLCFGVLCLLASSGVELWSRAAVAEDREVRAGHELALSLPLTLLGAAALVIAVRDDSMATRPFFYGILTGAALLQVLNRTHGRFPLETVKVLTALCLLAPGVIFQAYALSR